MPVWEMLNHEDHAALRISRHCDSGRHFAQITADEFPKAAPHYPILFTKHPETGAFYAGVVLGLRPGENLCAPDGKLPDYRPADLERQGFFVSDGQIVIDRQHPVFSGPHGELLFGADGEAALPLKRVQHAIHSLESGLAETEKVIRRFLEHGLLEAIDVSFRFDDGEHLRLDGLYSISLDRLHALPDDVALALFRGGDLQLAYVQSASVRHLRRLGRVHNDSLGEAAL